MVFLVGEKRIKPIAKLEMRGDAEHLSNPLQQDLSPQALQASGLVGSLMKKTHNSTMSDITDVTQ